MPLPPGYGIDSFPCDFASRALPGVCTRAVALNLKETEMQNIIVKTECKNTYRCTCGFDWINFAASACNDTCPQCGKEVSPLVANGSDSVQVILAGEKARSGVSFFIDAAALPTGVEVVDIFQSVRVSGAIAASGQFPPNSRDEVSREDATPAFFSVWLDKIDGSAAVRVGDFPTFENAETFAQFLRDAQGLQ